MWDFSLSRAFALMGRTMPYLLLRMAVYFGVAVAFVLVTGVGSGVGWGVGAIGGADGRATGAVWGGLIGFGLTAGVVILARNYVLYLVKGAHVAVLLELMKDGQIPGGKAQLTYGAGVVKERFGQASALFAMDQLVKGVIAAITGMMDTMAAILPIPGLNALVGIFRAFLKVAVGFIDEIILAYAIRMDSKNPWRSAQDALILYGQNYKVMLKNAAFLAVIVYGLSFLIFILMLAPAAGVAYIMPGPLSAIGILFALIFAWSVKAALIEPLAITCMMQVYFQTIEGQEPNPEWDEKLSRLTGKFRKLKEKGAEWADSAGGEPDPAPAAPQA